MADLELDGAPGAPRGPMIARRVLVRGRVQGVFFRQSCQQQARRVGVTGWVRNLGSGDVEIQVQGRVPAVARLVEWCREGPPHAMVSAVEVSDVAWEDLHGFAVR